MTTTKIEQIQDEFWITTYFNDGYTRSHTLDRTFKTYKGAERYLAKLTKNG